MNDYEEKLPPATPETQHLGAALSEGTYAQKDFSRSAEHSKARRDFHYNIPPFEDPLRDKSAQEMRQAEDRQRRGV